MTVTKAITLHPEYADAIAEGRKWIETRPSPPNGNMRPDGVRGLPGCAIDQYETIAIHAGAPRFEIVAKVMFDDVALVSWGKVYPFLPDGMSVVKFNKGRLTLHQYHVDSEKFWESLDDCCLVETVNDVTAELPLGDFTAERWAWLIGYAEPLAVPIPCKGKQGVWRLPADITEQIGGVL